MSTPFMNLTLPVPTVTLGPQWASELNTALDLIDSHDHTSGKGKPITTSALSIDANLDLNAFRTVNTQGTQFNSQTTALSGGANSSLIYDVNGDLYYTNGSGVAVQITSGGTVVTTPASVQVLELLAVTTDITIAPADTYVSYSITTSSPRTITIPLASAVSDGRFYVFKDATGQSETNTLTIAAQGADTIDGAATATVKSNFGAIMVQRISATAWSVI